MQTGDRRWSAAMGLLLGLSSLTNVEYFLGDGPARAGIGVAVWMWSRRTSGRHGSAGTRRPLWRVHWSAPVLAFVCLCMALRLRRMLCNGVLGAWPYVIDERITSLRFLQRT